MGDRVVGFCSGAIFTQYWCAGDVCYVSTLVVDTECRGKKIGAALMRAIEDMARGKMCKAIELDSGFHRESAHMFYEHIGFTKTAFAFAMELS